MVKEETLIEEMLREAEKAEEPGDFTKNRIISSEDDIPMVASKLESAGWVYVYDNVTGDRSLCNRNMLPSQLRKKREDGSFVFTTIKPKVTIKKGTFKCLLHEDNPNRKHYDELGLPVCKKANLTSPFQVQRHMAKRHRVEWETIEEEKKERERQEDRDFQRSIMAQAGLTGAKEATPTPNTKTEEALPLYVKGT
jgi:hypothetical protein